jgi:hypothetical protein
MNSADKQEIQYAQGVRCLVSRDERFKKRNEFMPTAGSVGMTERTVHEPGNFRVPRLGAPQNFCSRIGVVFDPAARYPLSSADAPRASFLNDRLTRTVDRVLEASWTLGGVQAAP